MRRTSRALLILLSFGVAGYAVFAYSVLPFGSLVHPDMKVNFLAHPAAIYAHVFASAVALVLGPFQFSENLRKRHLTIHRWSGRAYLGVGVVVGGLSGLYLSLHAFGGGVAQFGFGTLALLWLYTGLRAYLAARRGAIDAHRKWMVRNFSLTFAAVTLRLYLPAAIVAGAEFTLAYAVVAWLCWVPNLAFVEWRYNGVSVNAFDADVQKPRVSESKR